MSTLRAFCRARAALTNLTLDDGCEMKAEDIFVMQKGLSSSAKDGWNYHKISCSC